MYYSNKQTIVCDYCDDFVCGTVTELEQHQARYHSISHFFCKECNKQFASRRGIQNHLRTLIHMPITLDDVQTAAAAEPVPQADTVPEARPPPKKKARKAAPELAVEIPALDIEAEWHHKPAAPVLAERERPTTPTALRQEIVNKIRQYEGLHKLNSNYAMDSSVRSAILLEYQARLKAGVDGNEDVELVKDFVSTTAWAIEKGSMFVPGVDLTNYTTTVDDRLRLGKFDKALKDFVVKHGGMQMGPEMAIAVHLGRVAMDVHKDNVLKSMSVPIFANPESPRQ